MTAATGLHTLDQMRAELSDARNAMTHAPFDAAAIGRVPGGLEDAVAQLKHAHASVGAALEAMSTWAGAGARAAHVAPDVARRRLTATEAALSEAATIAAALGAAIAEKETVLSDLLDSGIRAVEAADPADAAEVGVVAHRVAQLLDEVARVRAQIHDLLEHAGLRWRGLASDADRLPVLATHPPDTAPQAYARLVRDFRHSSGLFRDSLKKQGPAYVWSLSQALAAAIALAAVPGTRSRALAEVRRILHVLAPYWNRSLGAYVPAPAGSGHHGSTAFYDDNAWVGMDLVAAYRLTGDGALLDRAHKIMAFEKSGWDRRGGGMFWNTKHTGRSTAATAGAAQLSLELARTTGSSTDLAWGHRAVTWTMHHLTGRSGLVHDAGDGRVFSYNQGLVIGDQTLLYQITGKTAHLHSATSLADAALKHFGAFTTQDPAFNAIFFRNLQHLNAALPVPNARYSRALVAYAATGSGARSTSLLQASGYTQVQAYAETPLTRFAAA